MLTLKQIEEQYPEHLRPFKKNILREYLQYKILEIIFESPLACKLSFLGGTALRIFYNNSRFSEDLDFDNFDMSAADFNFLAAEIKKGLAGEGFAAEIKNTFKGAYRCRVRLPGILFDNQLSALREEKILIQIDSAAHRFNYQPERKNLNKFGVFTQVFLTPLDILLAQKICALLERKRAKGRDFYDVVFLLSLGKPNYTYLNDKLKIVHPEILRQTILRKINSLNLNHLARDVSAFLFNPNDKRKVEQFKQFIEQVDLG